MKIQKPGEVHQGAINQVTVISSNHNFIKVHPETKSQSEEKPYPKNTEDYSRKDVIETSF